MTLVGNTTTYTPTIDFAGADSFTLQATDGSADSNVATVTVTVTPVNDAPTANNGAATADDATATPITLAATDVDGDSLTYTIVSGNTATYTATANFSPLQRPCSH